MMIRKSLLYIAGTACVATMAFVSLQAEDAPPPPPPPEAGAPVPPPNGGPKAFHKKPPGKSGWGAWGDRRGHNRPAMFDRGGPGHGRGGPDMLRALNLSDEQKAKVKEVLEGDKAKIMAILKEQREKIDAVRAESAKAIRPILTEEQRAVFDDAQKMREAGEKLREDIRKLHADKGEKTEKKP